MAILTIQNITDFIIDNKMEPYIKIIDNELIIHKTILGKSEKIKSDWYKTGDIVEKILYDFPELKRLRISSLDPAAIDSKLKNLLISEDRIMPHVHLSIQSGDNIILKRMKRRHSREQVIEL